MKLVRFRACRPLPSSAAGTVAPSSRAARPSPAQRPRRRSALAAPDIPVANVKAHLTAVAVHRHRQRRQPRPRPPRLQGLHRLREGQAGRGRIHHHPAAVHLQRRHRLQPDRRLAGRRPEPGRHGRVAPGQRHRRAPASTTTAPVARQSWRPRSPSPARGSSPRSTCGSRWWGAEELGLVGSKYYVNNLPTAERVEDQRLPELRHDRLAEPGLLRLRRRPDHREDLQGLLRGHRRRDGDRDRGRRPLRPRVRSRTWASRSAACSPAPTTSRRRPRRRSGAARRARPSTAATTRPATPRPTSTTPRSTATRTHSRTRCGSCPPRTVGPCP